MIYVIKTALKDVIVFDSVTSFSESYGGNVTSHPIEDGSKITDHSVVENPKFRISGVVSDYNFFNPIKDFSYNGLSSNVKSNIDYLNSIDAGTSQFTDPYGEDIPKDVSLIEDSTEETLTQITVSQVIKDKLIEIQRSRILVDILRYPGDGKVDKISPCILTDISFQESPDSGYAVYPEMQFEKITTVQVVTLQASADKIVPQELAKIADAAALKTIGTKTEGTSSENSPTQPDRKYIGLEASAANRATINSCLAQVEQMKSKNSRVIPPCVFEIRRTIDPSFSAGAGT